MPDIREYAAHVCRAAHFIMTKHVVAAAGELTEGQCKLVAPGGRGDWPCSWSGASTAPIGTSARTRARRSAAADGRICRAEPLRTGQRAVERALPVARLGVRPADGRVPANPRCTLDAYRVEVVDGAVGVWV